MLESTQSQEREPFARCSKARKSKGGAVRKMLESTQSQEGDTKSGGVAVSKIRRGAGSKILESTQSQEGEPLAKAHKVKRGEPLARCSKAHEVEGTVRKMLASTQSQEVGPLARCSKAQNKRGGLSKMLESTRSVLCAVQLALSRNWKASSGDIRAAFLNGVPAPRQLYFSQPRRGIPGMEPGSLDEILKGFFGLATSPKFWWLRLSSELRDLTVEHAEEKPLAIWIFLGNIIYIHIIYL